MTLTTDQQRDKALNLANEIRCARAETKRLLRNGSVSARVVIAEPSSHMLTASLLETLTAVRSVGNGVARKVCGRSNVNPLRQLGELTAGERGRLLRAMEGHRMFKR